MTQEKPLNITIGLDLSEMDQYLIQYAKILDQILSIEKITFIHNLKIGEIPKELLIPERINQIIAKITQRITSKIKESNHSYTFDIIVKMESYSEIAFMNLYKNQPIDLLVLGNKQELDGNGGLAHKLIRVLPCATLLVPETFISPITTIINAIDFSRYTSLVMSWADRFENNSKGQKITHSAVYISKFNWGFLPSMTDKDIKKETLLDIDRKRNTWNQKYALHSDIETVPAEDKSIATTLLKYCKQKKANMLILGVKGSAGIKDIFMGSVAHDVFQRSTDTCILFVKLYK